MPVLAVSLEPNDASTTLFAGHLAQRMPHAIRVVRYGDPSLSQQVAGASAIILVRGLFEFGGVVPAARLLGVPLYYFLDDNFMLLREQAGPWSPFVRRYSADNVRAQLRSFEGVLLSSEPLLDYFVAERLHASLALFPPVDWQEPLVRPDAAAECIRIAFFGGRHLHKMFSEIVVPAVRKLAAERPVTLIPVGVPGRIDPSPGLTIVEQPYNPSYPDGLRRLAAAGVDVLVHPVAADLHNGAYKIPHALIGARALGAVPVVSDRAPYRHLRGSGAAMLCEDSADSWYAALAQLSVPVRATISRALAAHCAANFGGQRNEAVINRMLATHHQPSLRTRGPRAVIAGAGILSGRLAAKVIGSS